MSATSRTMRAISVPSTPRLRRVTGLNSHRAGAISLFLAATGILGLTSLCYLWQSGQAMTAGMRIHTLNADLLSLQNTTQQLQSQIAQLQSYGVVVQAAYAKYGMKPIDPTTVRAINIPGPTVVRVVAVPAPAPAHLARARVRLGTTDAAVTSWWQGAWVAVYKLLR